MAIRVVDGSGAVLLPCATGPTFLGRSRAREPSPTVSHRSLRRPDRRSDLASVEGGARFDFVAGATYYVNKVMVLGTAGAAGCELPCLPCVWGWAKFSANPQWRRPSSAAADFPGRGSVSETKLSYAVPRPGVRQSDITVLGAEPGERARVGPLTSPVSGKSNCAGVWKLTARVSPRVEPEYRACPKLVGGSRLPRRPRYHHPRRL